MVDKINSKPSFKARWELQTFNKAGKVNKIPVFNTDTNFDSKLLRSADAIADTDTMMNTLSKIDSKWFHNLLEKISGIKIKNNPSQEKVLSNITVDGKRILTYSDKKYNENGMMLQICVDE